MSKRNHLIVQVELPPGEERSSSELFQIASGMCSMLFKVAAEQQDPRDDVSMQIRHNDESGSVRIDISMIINNCSVEIADGLLH